MWQAMFWRHVQAVDVDQGEEERKSAEKPVERKTEKDALKKSHVEKNDSFMLI